MNTTKFLSMFCVGIGTLLFLQHFYTKSQINSQNVIEKANIQPQTVASKSTLKSTPKAQESQPKIDQAKSKKLTDTAKFLAGIKVDSNSTLAKFQKSDSWVRHNEFFQNSWSKLENRQLKKVRKWSRQELKVINATNPEIFYPFSGPDILYAYSLFPKAKEYVMVGLEPAGNVSDLAKLSDGQRDWKLQEVRSSLYAILQFSFFMTNNMKVDFKKYGVLPILYVFLARTNNRILDVQNIGMDKNANIKPFEKGMIRGVKIAFVPQEESQARTLYYFSTDLSNEGLKQRPEFSKFIKKSDKKVTYLKAASYLMHAGNFSAIRNLILDESTHILQDDSGMPLKAFDKSEWDLKFYGAYNGPIALFSNSYQGDLKSVYRKGKNIKPLNFGIGYKFGVNDSNLMLAETKNLSTSR